MITNSLIIQQLNKTVRLKLFCMVLFFFVNIKLLYYCHAVVSMLTVGYSFQRPTGQQSKQYINKLKAQFKLALLRSCVFEATSH